MYATESDLQLLENIYGNRQLYQGEAHDHAATGGTSDGKRTLEHWKGALEAQEMDFACILDHKQVRHMYLPEWDETIFFGGTEAGGNIKGKKGTGRGTMDFNLVFSKPEPLMALLEEFPEFEFTGGAEGHFRYRSFTRERYVMLMDAVERRGGFFVIPHPKCSPYSDDPTDFWFKDGIGLEVPYISLDSVHTKNNYEVWRTILDMGKRVWVCAGGDKHACAHDWALTSIYMEEKNNDCYVKHCRKGDFTAGPIGIQMCVGDTQMGGTCDFEGKRLVIGVGKFHRSVCNPEHKYRLDLWDNTGIIYSQEISCEEPTYLAMDASDKAQFYRVEIYDVNKDLRLALGNPIWNEKEMKIYLKDNGYGCTAARMKTEIQERIPARFEEEGLFIELCMDNNLPAEHYQIHAAGEGWKIIGADETGLFYGVQKFLHTALWKDGKFVPDPPKGVMTAEEIEKLLYGYEAQEFPKNIYENMTELRVDGKNWKIGKNNECWTEEGILQAEALADDLFQRVGEKVKRTWRFRILRLHAKIDRIMYDIHNRNDRTDNLDVYEVRNVPNAWLWLAEDRVPSERILELHYICNGYD